MRKIEFVFNNFYRDVCPRIKNVVSLKDEKLFLKVYASRKITVCEVQRLIDGYKIFNITLEFVKYEKIPFTNDCSILFEVYEDE